jgi:hypothetical protein
LFWFGIKVAIAGFSAQGEKMITQKRPFSINIELQRNEMTKLVIDLGIKCSTFETKEEGNTYSEYDCYKRVHIKCPCCSLCNYSRKLHKYRYKEISDFNYVTGYLYILDHIKTMVRLHGERSHMQFILDYFGKEKGLFILENWAKKNILVARLISEFITESEEIKRE